jgi:hypothetical protein
MTGTDVTVPLTAVAVITQYDQTMVSVPDVPGRIERAAMELTGERGFDNITTVAEVARYTVTHEP